MVLASSSTTMPHLQLGTRHFRSTEHCHSLDRGPTALMTIMSRYVAEYYTLVIYNASIMHGYFFAVDGGFWLPGNVFV